MPDLQMEGKEGMGTECVERGTGCGGGRGLSGSNPIELAALLLADQAI